MREKKKCKGQRVKSWLHAEDSFMSDVVQTSQWETMSVLLMVFFSPCVHSGKYFKGSVYDKPPAHSTNMMHLGCLISVDKNPNKGGST